MRKPFNEIHLVRKVSFYSCLFPELANEQNPENSAPCGRIKEYTVLTCGTNGVY